MKVRMLSMQAGERFQRNIGEVHDIEDSEADRLIRAGFAEETEPRVATRHAPENAAQNRPGRPNNKEAIHGS